MDHTDVLGTDNLTTVNGVNDAATETLIVNGAALGVIATKDFSGLTLDNVTLDYRGGVGSDNVTGTTAANIISGGFGVDILNGGGGSDTLTGGEGSDTFTVEGNDSETNIVVITDFEATAAGDTLNLVNSTINAASVAVGVNRQDIDGGAVTRTDGLTVESFSVTATGEVTLFDSNTALGTTTAVFAQTAADVVALTEALHLNIGASNVITFGLDADANGTAESTIVASTDITTGETNIVQLSNVAFGADLGNAPGADTINVDTLGGFNVVTAVANVLQGTLASDSYQIAFNATAQEISDAAGGGFEIDRDVIDFTGASLVANVATPGGTTIINSTDLDGTADSIFANTGLIIIDNTVAAGYQMATLDAAGLEAVLADLDGEGDNIAFAADDSVVYIAASDGTDAAIFVAEAGAGDQVIDEAEITLVVKLTGVDDLSTLTAANFLDFV